MGLATRGRGWPWTQDGICRWIGRRLGRLPARNLPYLSYSLHDLFPQYLLHGIRDKATLRLMDDPKDRRDPKARSFVKTSHTSSDVQDKTARRSVENLKGRCDSKAC